MGFIELFLKRIPSEIKKLDVEGFISRKIEENLKLDYKDIRAYSNFEKLSRDVSAFANSEGGLIMLGVSEEKLGKGKNLKIFPKEITWGDETLSKERLEDNIIGKIHPRIRELRIVPVREGNGSLRVIFLIDIPQSDNPPHMASDYRYYQRLNFRRVPMEHYTISDFFGRRRKPDLSLNLQLINVQLLKSTYQVIVRFLLTNSGKAIAKYTQLSASFHNLEILRTSHALRSASTHRIDDLRGGIPSIQYNSSGQILFPYSLPLSIGEITFKVLDIHSPIKIEYHLIAEDMKLLFDRIEFPVVNVIDKAKFMTDRGQQPMLKELLKELGFL